MICIIIGIIDIIGESLKKTSRNIQKHKTIIENHRTATIPIIILIIIPIVVAYCYLYDHPFQYP